MVAETKKTDILTSLGQVKAPASLTCLGKVRVGEEGLGVKTNTYIPQRNRWLSLIKDLCSFS